MYKFLIQVDSNDVPMFDFGFEMYRAIKYKNSFENQNNYSYRFAKNTFNAEKGFIPIGSLEFVMSYMSEIEMLDTTKIKPINIVNYFDKSKLGREVVSDLGKNLSVSDHKFVKDISKYKGFTDITNNIPKALDDKLILISDVVDFDSEFRLFIMSDRVVGCKQYLGDYSSQLDMNYVNILVNDLYNSDLPYSYSMDIGVDSNGKNYLIEIHPCVSLGLYGYNNYNNIIPMYIQGYNYFKNICESRV